MSWKPICSMILCLACSCAVFLSGCGGYGEVSPRAYQSATAVFSICNRRDADRIPIILGLIANARDNAEITEQEAKWLRDILSQAQRGDWEKALKQARRLMEDQVQGR